MDQEETTVDPQYLKGFNNGYQIAKYEPRLAERLAANPNEQNPYFKGMISGKDQYHKEMREWLKSFYKGRSAKDDRGIEKER